MKKIIIITFLLLFSSNTFAQKHEIGAFLGGANAIADIGKTDWVNPFPRKLVEDNKIPFSIGFIYRYNLNPQQSLRFSLSYASIGDHNKNAGEDYRRNNNKKDWYANKIIELSSVFEYNFFPINTEQEYAHSPYIFAGMGLFGADKYTYKVKRNKEEDKDSVKSLINTAFSTSIPFGLGYKYKFNWNWIIGAEVGFRATFVDYLERRYVEDKDFQFSGEYYKVSEDISKDEIDRRKKEVIEDYKVGDNRKNDWYVFTGLTLTYTFGRPACFCD